MLRKFAALSLALAAGILVACGGGRGLGPNAGMGGATSFALPPLQNDISIDATLPKHSFGENLPTSLGTIWMKGAKVGGFTQTQYSQTLAFPPGTKITIHNLSKTDAHTVNVIKALYARNARVKFPSNPTLSMTPHGGHNLQVGFASGPIQPGHTFTVVLVKEGTYMIGCAFHYKSNGMRDILVVKAGAKPGPQATPPPSGGSPSPQPSSTRGGGGGWDPTP
jgi:plastocyanin